jgi:urease subunit gamma/beta
MLVVEGQFRDGTRLITVMDPITPGTRPDTDDPLGPPGAVITPDGDIELNAGLPTVEVEVTNTGDRAIQVSSHHPFAEVNDALAFDRSAAHGRRLDVPAGTTVRFEPGIPTRVVLVPFPDGGARVESRRPRRPADPDRDGDST